MIKATSETFRGQLEELAEASRTWCRKAFLTVTGEIAVTGFDEYRAENGQLIDLPEQTESEKVQGA